MKINKFFVAAMAAMTLFASCSKETEGPKVGTNTDAMVVKISYGDETSTYSSGTPAVGSATKLTDAILYQMMGDNVFSATELDQAACTLLSSSGYVINNVNTSVDGVLIVGNVPTSAKVAMKALVTRSAITGYALSIDDQQAVVDATKIPVATMIGSGAVSGTATAKTASAVLVPIVARMEVSKGPINSSGTSNQIETLTVDKIYFNNFYAIYPKAGLVNKKDVAGFDALPVWAIDAWAVKDGTTGCFAYQFFPDIVPMIVLKTTIKYKGVSATQTRYLTINKFKTGANDLSKTVANKIYKVDLSSLTVDHTNFTPAPNPDEANLTVKVTVTPWTIETLTPAV